MSQSVAFVHLEKGRPSTFIHIFFGDKELLSNNKKSINTTQFTIAGVKTEMIKLVSYKKSCKATSLN